MTSRREEGGGKEGKRRVEWKRRRVKGGEKKIAPSLSFLFVVALVHAGPPTLRIRRAPLCCAAFCQPGEERNTLSLVKRNTMGHAEDRTVSSKVGTREF